MFSGGLFRGEEEGEQGVPFGNINPEIIKKTYP